MDGLGVIDLCEVSGHTKVISVSGDDRKMLEFKVSYNGEIRDKVSCMLQLQLQIVLHLGYAK